MTLAMRGPLRALPDAEPGETVLRVRDVGKAYGPIGNRVLALEGISLCLLYTSPSPRDRG